LTDLPYTFQKTGDRGGVGLELELMAAPPTLFPSPAMMKEPL